MKLQKLLTTCFLAAAMFTARAQKDVTSDYVKNPSFESGTTSWTVTSMVKQTNTSFTKKDGTTYIEKWVNKGSAVGSASVVQSLSGLPLGEYELTVAAQNLDQNNTSKKCDGARIFAGLCETPVYTTKDYTVTFSVLNGKADIGFEAVDAKGNWLAVDNFRLKLIREFSPAEIVAEMQKLSDEAEAYLSKTISKTVTDAITKAVQKGRAITESSKPTDVTIAYNALVKAITDAKASMEQYDELAKNIPDAEALLPQMMSATAKTNLTKYLEAAKAITTANTTAQVTTALKNLIRGIEAAMISISDYMAVVNAIEIAEKEYDATKKGADEFHAVIETAKYLSVNPDAKSTELADMVRQLERATLKFHLDNATHGSGTPVKVTATNSYVATGATEALMRATMTGSNILERGVCWSTEHEPTVLDDRTTEFHTLNGNIYHVRGLNVATVYYLRPYVMNKTYEVAYGDEVKIVTHPKGTCVGTWDGGAPDDAANTRCRNAISETIEYFNQWTGIKGFTLSGHYGAQTPTADCSYGGWMRIGPNAGNQAIGTVIHETGHGVGVGTCDRWKDTNVHNWKWYGREANKIYSFLENKEANPYTSDFCMVGDGMHGWGSSASYDWFVNGADKDKHQELQYLGGCCLLYGLFVDGLPPTGSYPNGLSSYTYNFDDEKVYYIRSESSTIGINDSYLCESATGAIQWRKMTDEEAATVENNAAWYLEYDAQACYYRFRNAQTGHYISHTATSVSAVDKANPSVNENFQLMPGRVDVTTKVNGKNKKTYGYWFTWNAGGNKGMQLGAANTFTGVGTCKVVNFDFSDKATDQRYIILSGEELGFENIYTSIENVTRPSTVLQNRVVSSIYNLSGVKVPALQHGINIVKYSDGTSEKVYVK